MRGARVPRTGLIEVCDWPRPHLQRAGDLVVRMLEASICGSDVHAVLEGNIHPRAASIPGYPGHEGVGIVVESASTVYDPGRLVLTLPLGQLGGCFAEYQLLDDAHVLPLDDAIDTSPDGLRVQALAQQLGTCIFARRLVWPDERRVRHGESAVVLGAGSAGLFFLDELQRVGFDRVVVLERNPERAEAARGAGAEAVEQAEQLQELTTGSAAGRLVVDAIGSDEARQLAINVAAPDADVILFGVPSPLDCPAPIDVYAAQTKRLTLRAMVGAQSEPGLPSFRRAQQQLLRCPDRYRHTIGRVLGLEDLPLAFQKAANPMPGDGVKTFIHIDDL